MSTTGFSVNEALPPFDRIIAAAGYVFDEQASGLTVATIDLADGRQAQAVLTANQPDIELECYAGDMTGLVRYPDRAIFYEHHLAPAALGGCAINQSRDCLRFRAQYRGVYQPTDAEPMPGRLLPEVAAYGLASTVESFATGEQTPYDHSSGAAREAVVAVHGMGHFFRDPALRQLAVTLGASSSNYPQ